MRLRHLVVVIPGIGGSVLQTASGKPVWGQDRSRLAGAIIDPGRLSLSEHPQLVAVDVLRSIRLMPPLPFTVHGYDTLISAIGTAFHRVTDTDLLLFPYDFRRGVRVAAEQLKAAIDARLAGLTSDARTRRVIVVAHSLGGLVARYWLGPLRGATDCRALITVGTPHRGAPKALDWLVNGVRVGPQTLASASEVLRSWTTAYDLLPRYPAIRRGTETLYPHELAGVAATAFVERARDAYAMHRDIQTAWSALSDAVRPEVIPLFARGHATPAAAEVHDGRLTVRKADADWLPNHGWAGDGTVPSFSAIPIELDDRRGTWTPVTERHTPMPSASVIVEVLKNFAGDSLAPAQGDAPAGPWLGLDLEDQVPAGAPVTVGAVLHGLTDGFGGSAIWATVWDVSTGRRIREPVQLAFADGRWSGELEGLPPGGYRIVVRAVNVPGPQRVTCEDIVSVVALG